MEQENGCEICRQRETALVYLKLINKLLQLNTRESSGQLVQLYMQEEFVQNYMAVRPELVSGRILAMITCDELALHRTSLYARQFHDLEEFIFNWDRLKFKLWELEFFDDGEAQQGFFNHIQTYSISDIALKYLLYTSAIDKKEALLQIVNAALSVGGDVQLALLLLGHGCELFQEDEEIPLLLAKLQAAVGK